MAKFDRMFQDTAVKKAEPHPKRDTKWLHYTKLTDHKLQYCNEKNRMEIEALAGLIEADKGVMQNLLVRKTDSDTYEIIAGHKRRRACKLLVEEEGKKEYEFLPCTVLNVSDIQARFQLCSSNRFHDKDDYERMHELEEMKYLLENFPEEFPHLQTGRMVERLAKQTQMKRTTVGEYLAISKNLGEKGKEEFKNGSLKKSAAVELAGLQEQEQEQLLGQGITSYKEIRSYKECRQEEQACPGKIADAPAQKAEPESDPPLTGQYKVINTEMEIGEEEKEANAYGEDDGQRKVWLRNYQEWGIWYADEHIGAVYYKYDFPDGTRLIAETYPQEEPVSFLHLTGGPKERELDPHGRPKYPYHERYSRYPDCETEVIAFLKAVQKK